MQAASNVQLIHRFMARVQPLMAARAAWFMALCLALAFLSGAAHAADRTPFDHLTTGFELVGKHRDLPCESCHVNAIFKGTSRECAACHGVGATVRASAKPVAHILSSNLCGACHTPVAWSPAVNFDHAEVRGSCSSCHNGVQAQGKGPTHIDTDLECDLCHTTIGWAGAVFNHTNVTSGCASCHNGSSAKGPPATHIPTGPSPMLADPGNAPCEACHTPTNYVTFAGTRMNHPAVTPPMPCATCHEAGNSFFGVTFETRPPPPHPTVSSGDCAACHTSTVSWSTGTLQPAGHIPTTQACTLCHANPADYKQYTMNHAGISKGCVDCHAAGLTFAVNFVPTHPSATHINFGGAACESCHSNKLFDTFRFPGGNASGAMPPAMVHSAVASASCTSCHGPTASDSGMPATKTLALAPNHVPFGSASCAACHDGTTFLSFMFTNASGMGPPAMVHSAVPGIACSTCHENTATGQPGSPPTVLRAPTETHITGNPVHPASGECSDCHQSTVKFWGTGATSYPTDHIPLLSGNAAPCASCHTDPSTFSTATMDHSPTLITAVCETCHAGVQFANVMPTSPATHPKHIPFGTAKCTDCHTEATTFANFHMTAPKTAMNHTVVGSIACATCHGLGKSWYGVATVVEPVEQSPGGHIPINGAACTACHSGTDFSTFALANPKASMNHGAVTSIACGSCHGKGMSWAGMVTVVQPPAQTGGHIGIGTAVCTGCHTAGNFTTFKIANDVPPMNHAVITTAGRCSVCHENTSPVWMGTPGTWVRPLNYIWNDPNSPAHVSAGECDTCHFKFTDFKGATDLPANHIPIPAADNNDCALCHTTPGNYDVAFMVMNHKNITSNCAQCHAANSSFAGMAPPTLKVPPSNHVPFGTAKCESCHDRTNFTMPGGFKFTNASGTAPPAMVHAAVPGVACATCHGAGTKIWIGTPATVKPPSNHIPIGTAACESCHLSTSVATGGFKFTNASGTKAPAMVHAAVPGVACATCHGAGTTVWVGTPATKKPPSNHIPSGAAACEGCHMSSSVATGGFSFPNKSGTTPGHMVHTALASRVCSTCHEKGTTVWVGAPITVKRPTNKSDGTPHVTGGECDTCHVGYVDFTGAQDLPGDHIPLPTADSNNCGLCHKTSNYSVAVMNHVNITVNCMQCHAYGLTFAGLPLGTLVQPPSGPTGHIPSNRPTGATDRACEQCHLPTVFTTFAGTIMKHVAVRDMQCMDCHEIGMKWKTNTGKRLWVRDGANHYKGQDCDGAKCHNARDKMAVRRATTMGSTDQGTAANPSLRAGAASALGGAAGFDHRRVVGQACLSCHGPASGIGKPGNHIATTDNCESCHMTGAWLPVKRVDHLQVKGSCISCHNGTVAAGKGSRHIVSGDSCETCHTSNAWTPARFDHATVAAHTCKTCHDSLHAMGLPVNHVPTTAQCDTCHGTLGWKPAKLDHTTLTANCATCHNNSIALGVTPTHMTMTRDCATCHSYPDWSVLHFVHAAANFPGQHRAAMSCVSCHTTNTDQIPWPTAAQAGSCAGCHASDFKPDLHPKTADGSKYTVGELRDCTGACHVYSDATLGTVAKPMPGPYHRVSDAAFKH